MNIKYYEAWQKGKGLQTEVNVPTTVLFTEQTNMGIADKTYDMILDE